ncbi:MAG: hypothetical protein M3Q46_13025 [Verrucomicrobiota bacterium]|nr:hypothetical protein [Verrucomicrobiota bacterium]
MIGHYNGLVTNVDLFPPRSQDYKIARKLIDLGGGGGAADPGTPAPPA